MGSFRKILDDCQYFIYREICRQPYKIDKNDCSNKSYQLYYWWKSLDYPCQIYTCFMNGVWHAGTGTVTSGVWHAQVELYEKGLYDPTTGRRIESKSYKAIKSADHPKQKLPSNAKFDQYITDDYIYTNNQFSMTDDQFSTMSAKLLDKGWNTKRYIKPNLHG